MHKVTRWDIGVPNHKERELFVGVITDNGQERFDVLKKSLGLGETFDVLVNSAQTNSFKSSEKIFTTALGEASVEPQEAIFIDNKEKNLAVPSEMGMHTIYFNSSAPDVPALQNEIMSIL